MHPREVVHINFLTVEAGKGVHINFLTVEAGKRDREVNILVVTDHFTMYLQAYVTPSQTAKVIARTLCYIYFMHYGLAEKIVSDQGCNFESSLI